MFTFQRHSFPQVSQRLVTEFTTEADVQEIGSVLCSWLDVLTGTARKASPLYTLSDTVASAAGGEPCVCLL